MNEDQNIGVNNTAERVDPLSKKIAANHALHVGVDKCRPGEWRLFLGLVWRRMVSRFLKNVSSGRVSDFDTQLFQFSDDAPKSPSQIIIRKNAGPVVE